jgi:hypothetical protein
VILSIGKEHALSQISVVEMKRQCSLCNNLHWRRQVVESRKHRMAEVASDGGFGEGNQVKVKMVLRRAT